MGVYIDREQAIKCLDGNVLITRQSEAEAVREYFEMVIKRLENLPTTDLVRCGSCPFSEMREDMGFTCYVNNIVDDDRFLKAVSDVPDQTVTISSGTIQYQPWEEFDDDL